jgi:peptide-methionine (R)-S-oxide reductase
MNKLSTIKFLVLIIALAALANFMVMESSHAQSADMPEDIVAATEKLNKEKGVELTPYQYYITQKEGTEKPFENEYWDNKEPGIYVDVVTGEALFSSLDKYDSGTGWPSFTKPLHEENIVEKPDNKLTIPRTEVESSSGSHLGHVFQDGPKDKGGERYCINSASLKFIHEDDLEKEGYGEYLALF